MKYHDGEEVKIGDVVSLGGDDVAVVVGIIEDGLSSKDCNIEEWKYLKVGVLFQAGQGSKSYFSKPDEDTVLIRRGES